MLDKNIIDNTNWRIFINIFIYLKLGNMKKKGNKIRNETIVEHIISIIFILLIYY